jgi:hypothetical protein
MRATIAKSKTVSPRSKGDSGISKGSGKAKGQSLWIGLLLE